MVLGSACSAEKLLPGIEVLGTPRGEMGNISSIASGDVVSMGDNDRFEKVSGGG
jgi:hypothetical protein